MLIASYHISVPSANLFTIQITDSADVVLSGASPTFYIPSPGGQTQATLVGYVSPASVLALTYKTMFFVEGGNGILNNNLSTGQLFAIEVSA